MIALRYYKRFIDEVAAHDSGSRRSVRPIMAEALLQIAEPGETRAKRPAGRARRHRSRDHELAGRRRRRRQAGLPDGRAGDARSLPSVVHYAGDGAVVVGAEARDRLAPDFPRDTIASVKRFMGRGPQRRRGDAAADAVSVRRAPARPGQDRTTAWCDLRSRASRAVTPMEVSAEILQGAQDAGGGGARRVARRAR